MKKGVVIPNETIINNIYLIRNQKVMLDKDLARLFGVETKQLKRQVRRNINRFPSSFMFELSLEENTSLRSQFGTLKKGAHSKYSPFAFTEHGILMLSSVLNSEIAIKMSIQIIETFIQLRQLTNNYDEIKTRMQEMDAKNNKEFSEIYEILTQLLSKPKDIKRVKIGYKNK